MSNKHMAEEHTTPASLSSHRLILSPLDVPELLQLIFSYIDRYTLAKTVVRVCRRWFFLNSHRIGREVTWDLKWRPSLSKQALLRLPGAGRLVLFCVDDHKWQGPDLHAALLALQRHTNILWSTLAPLLGYHGSPITEQLYQPLRELTLKTGHNFQDDWLNRLPFPPSLTSLSIEKTQMLRIDLTRILALCPLLERIRISSPVFSAVHDPRRRITLPDHLPLRSLVLKHLFVPQSWMEDILVRMPNLEELKLTGLCRMDKNIWDWPRFQKHLQSLSFPLKQFHYSIQLIRAIDEKQEEAVVAMCPNAKERTLSLYSLTPKVIRNLTVQSTVLSTLEIILSNNAICHREGGWTMHFQDHASAYTARPLHQLLCEGSSLRHLKTLKMPYMVDFMDIHRRHTNYITDEDLQKVPVSSVPGIWACRGLETLQLQLHFHGSEDVGDWHHMRVACGYVSRVCPRLTDLTIAYHNRCNRPQRIVSCKQGTFKFEAGICLLSRLKRLERLRLDGTYLDCGETELDWLCPSGRTLKKNMERWGIVEQWTRMLKDEATLDAKRLERIGAKMEMTILGEAVEDVELMDSLKNLGLLLDVKEMAREMTDIDFVCLPELRRLACGCHLEQSPEKEISSFFYKTPPAARTLVLWEALQFAWTLMQ